MQELIRRGDSEREFFYNHIVQYFRILNLDIAVSPRVGVASWY